MRPAVDAAPVASSADSSDGASPQATEPGIPSLHRRLGLPIAVAVVVGSVIGSGIFYKPGTIAADAGNFPLIISVWILGGVICILGGLCFAELATMFPQAGGLYVYLREAYGRPVAFLFGWSEVAFAKPAGIAALAVAFVSSLGKAMDWKTDSAGELLLVAVLITGLAAINILGVQWGGRLQFAVTVGKIAFLALVGALPFLLSLGGRDVVHIANYESAVTPLKHGFWNQAAAAMLAVMWAYHGWHSLTPLAEEVRDPQRNMPRGLLYGIGIVTFLYLFANVAYHGAMSMSQMSAAGKHAAEQMLHNILGPVGAIGMSLLIPFSAFGAINGNLLEAPRVAFAMGRDRVFFRGLARVHVNYGTPSVAIALTALMSIVAVASAAGAKFLVRNVDAGTMAEGLKRQLVEGLQQNTVFGLLTNFVVFSSTVFFVLCVLAVFILRFTRPDHPRPYRTWGYPWVPLAFLAVNIPFLWQSWLSNPVEAGAGLGVMAVGLPVYFAFQRGVTQEGPGS